MRHGIIKAEDHTYPLAIAALRLKEDLFQRAIPARQHHQLQAECHYGVERLGQDVESLLSGHPRYHSDHRQGLRFWRMREIEVIAQAVKAELLVRAILR